MKLDFSRKNSTIFSGKFLMEKNNTILPFSGKYLPIFVKKV
jgi:hypothetical protein